MHSLEFVKLWSKLTKEFQNHMEEQLAPALTEAQLTVLEVIGQQERLKPSDLLPIVMTTPAAITTLLDRMEKNELIARVRDSDDRRVVWIHMTARGEQEKSRGLQIREKYIEDVLNRISAHNQQLFIYLLGKITNEAK